MNIPAQRLHNQHITRPRRGSVADLVAALGAVQAQEYPFAKWALALRLAGSRSDADIEAAVQCGDILRTHLLRPTWHFVAAADIRWMLQVTAPRVHARLATYLRRLELPMPMLRKATAHIERALGDGRHLTREQVRALLVDKGIDLKNTRLMLTVMYAELEGVICSGRRQGKQFTYALVSERASKARTLDRDEALAELARRYFSSHGPATIRDFVWWSSLATADARRAVDMIGARRLEQGGLTYWSVGAAKAAPPRAARVHLLPIYDEYLVAYRDRVAVPHGTSSYGLGSLSHALVIDGHVAGLWTTDRRRVIDVSPSRRLSASEWQAVQREGHRFAAFIGAELEVVRRAARTAAR